MSLTNSFFKLYCLGEQQINLKNGTASDEQTSICRKTTGDLFNKNKVDEKGGQNKVSAMTHLPISLTSSPGE